MTTELRHRYAHTNGIRMHYVEQGDGPLVLLCHGWPESWYSWRHQIPVLAGAGFRVVARELGLPEDIVNVEGGAIAHGHPIGATGAVLTTRLIHSMRRDGLKRGIATLCIGGGQGIALALEMLS